MVITTVYTVLKRGGPFKLPKPLLGPLQIVISRIPLTLQLSFFAKCVLFNISLYGSTHNHNYLVHVNHMTKTENA